MKASHTTAAVLAALVVGTLLGALALRYVQGRARDTATSLVEAPGP